MTSFSYFLIISFIHWFDTIIFLLTHIFTSSRDPPRTPVLIIPWREVTVGPALLTFILPLLFLSFRKLYLSHILDQERLGIDYFQALKTKNRKNLDLTWLSRAEILSPDLPVAVRALYPLDHGDPPETALYLILFLLLRSSVCLVQVPRCQGYSQY